MTLLLLARGRCIAAIMLQWPIVHRIGFKPDRLRPIEAGAKARRYLRSKGRLWHSGLGQIGNLTCRPFSAKGPLLSHRLFPDFCLRDEGQGRRFLNPYGFRRRTLGRGNGPMRAYTSFGTP